MKLIPVQMVNGQFFQCPISKTDSTQQKAVGVNIASAPVQTVQKTAPSPSATQQVVSKQVSIINVFPNQVGLDRGSSLNKHPLQQQKVNLIAVVPQMETPAANSAKSGRLPGPLPVTVKAPGIPRGRYLQITPNATVPRVPAVQTVPTVPRVPAVQTVPTVPRVPAVQTVPTVPRVPAVQTVPTVPRVSAVQTVPTVPRVSAVQTVPTVPRVSAVQTVPTVPRVSAVQTVPTVPRVSAVQTVPASVLPPRVKRPIFPSPANSSPSSGSAGVVYTSPPVTTVSPQSVSALDTLKFLCNVSNATSCGSPSEGSKPHLKLIPKVSQRPNSPIKWVIEEEDSFTAPVLDPVNFSVSSEILQAVAERESATKPCDALTNPVSGSSLGKSGQGQESTSVTCNRKVVLAAKNGSIPYKMGKSISPTAAGKSYEYNKTTVPSSQQSLESVSPQKRQGDRIIIPKGSHEVIDLCDDDALNDSSQPASSVHMSAATRPDEDNVIFVSYIPPKTDSESTQDLRLKTQMAPVKETDKTGTSSSNKVTEQKSPGGTTGTLIRRKPVHSMSVNTVKNVTRVCGSAAMNMQNNEGPNISSQRSTTTQQSKGVEVDVERKSPADRVNIASAAVQMVNKAALSPSAPQQVVRKQVSLMNVFPNQVCLDLPLQQQKVNLIAVVPQMETPAANSAKSGRLPGTLPVTVKAPAIPRGRYLQITPNATVPAVPTVPRVLAVPTVPAVPRVLAVPTVSTVPAVPTVPASELPPRVKRPIFPSPANSSPSSGSAGVVYTSPPVTTVSPQSVSALDTLKFLCNVSNATSCGSPSEGPKPNLKLIPKASQRPNSPIKWVVEEEDSFTAPVLDPVNSSVSSEIIRVVAERESATKHCDALTNPVSGTEQKSLDGTTDADRGRKPGRSMSIDTGKNITHVCGSAAMNMQNNEGPNFSSQQSTATQQSESMEVDVKLKSPENPSNSDSSEIAMDTHKMKSSVNAATSWTSSPAPESCRMADNLLRQIFGITANVKVCLQRIDGASVGSRPAGLRGKELFLKDLNRPQESGSCSGVNVPTEQELLEGSATPSAHTDIEPLKCSHLKPNTKPLSVLKNKRHLGDTSLKGTSCDVETEPAFGYVEPIDEDFLSMDENDIPNAQDPAGRPQTQTCADLNANTRRMGRTRKRTMCPCCIPGAQDPKSEEPEDWAWATEQTSKKGRRTKAVRKAVKTSGRTDCLRAKNKRGSKTSEVPASDSLSAASVDSEELKQHEQIRKLRELLKEQEAALEVMRNGTS
ncbi:ligand-dependent nuclear receptor-interacting factor 1 isoform X2 [Sander lucioperca]|nr:ligand-dependent nuclear receptor-interacting factor 1 isoform X2 [Sander lucioperca]